MGFVRQLFTSRIYRKNFSKSCNDVHNFQFFHTIFMKQKLILLKSTARNFMHTLDGARRTANNVEE